MDNIYLIDYEVDTGYQYIRDKALVFADCKNTAKYKLSRMIDKLGNEYIVSHYYSVEEFNADVFSAKFKINC